MFSYTVIAVINDEGKCVCVCVRNESAREREREKIR